MANRRLQAKCLCGGVRIDADVEPQAIGVCHCDICRRWASAPFMALKASDTVVLSGTDSLGIYESSAWGERGFCNRCGTSLFWRSKDAGHYAISAMAFDDLGDAAMSDQIFIDSKPAWYAFANETKTMTGAEFFAQFASEEDKPNG
ncbi:GFA family protein [Jiella sp. MQZ9-1]|uniref:GFA family protein n=1 Tax=Jiella flava TaxID=2816857 RepID=A0A939FZW7_9HYPH|nr:GFA family protein [Jiella flava]MBO0663796.1 GFA family protein [Jiella flava]MCD2472369.1 GFA family protein [Jiella flava]